MTLHALIEKLKNQRDAIENTIEILQSELKSQGAKKTRKKIIKSLPKNKETDKDTDKGAAQKGFVYGPKNPHWTQLPRNKKRVQAMAAKRAKMNRKKKTK